MKYLLLFISCLFLQELNAQDTVRTASVIVHKDPRVDMLIKKQAAINLAVKKATAHTLAGYRVLVISTNNRDEAIAAKTKVYKSFPELKIYLSYQAPYYRLKAGNFKTRAEAVNYQKALNAQFPKGVYVINDTIEMKAETDKVEVQD